MGTDYSYTTTVPAPYTGQTSTNLYCVGQTFLADGRLATFGGHWVDEGTFIDYDNFDDHDIVHGRPDADLFSQGSGEWDAA
jgi:hypothetical protein